MGETAGKHAGGGQDITTRVLRRMEDALIASKQLHAMLELMTSTDVMQATIDQIIIALDDVCDMLRASNVRVEKVVIGTPKGGNYEFD